MVSAILLHYVIDDPLPTRGTFNFGDPGADNFFFVFECFSFFFNMLSSFFHMVLLHKLLFYLVCMVASCYITKNYIPSRKKKKKKKTLGLWLC